MALYVTKTKQLEKTCLSQSQNYNIQHPKIVRFFQFVSVFCVFCVNVTPTAGKLKTRPSPVFCAGFRIKIKTEIKNKVKYRRPEFTTKTKVTYSVCSVCQRTIFSFVYLRIRMSLQLETEQSQSQSVTDRTIHCIASSFKRKTASEHNQ